MSEHTIPANGAFCWNELGTTNLEDAKKFYTELLGWKLKQSDVTGSMIYHEIMVEGRPVGGMFQMGTEFGNTPPTGRPRSEEHTSELQSRFDLVCRLLLEKKK